MGVVEIESPKYSFVIERERFTATLSLNFIRLTDLKSTTINFYMHNSK